MLSGKTLIINGEIYAIVKDYIDKKGIIVYSNNAPIQFRDSEEALSYLKSEDLRRSIEFARDISYS